MQAYLDHAAGGPLDPAAVEAMRPWVTASFGNPSGVHRVARAARAAIDDARDTVADFLGVAPGEVIFTSGGTESDNLAVLGVAGSREGAIVVGATEHPAVMEAASASGREVRIAGVDVNGLIDLDGLERLLDADVALVSVQLACHETGVVQPLRSVARVVRRRARNALVHTDAAQAAGWLDLATEAGCADLISISAHKFGGPQGAGALAARGRPALRPVLFGGRQERELRSGTHNVAGIVGMAAACTSRHDPDLVASLRDSLATRIKRSVPTCVETAASTRRVPGHLHLRFPGLESEALLVLLDEAGVCASAGAACASGAMEPSPVLLAMGVDKKEALSSLRLTLGPSTTAEEVDFAGDAVVAAVGRLTR